MPTKRIAHKVNHIALAVDKSGSMAQHEETVIRVVDEFVKGLKEESKRLGQETRISLYAFDHTVECLVWDMSVQDLPSLRDIYRVNGGATSLLEATVLSLDDLRTEVSEKYGEHSFLQITWTDGIENASGLSETGEMHSSPDGHRVLRPAQLDKWRARLQRVIGSLPDHWTSAILVPNSLAKRKAQEYGFPAGNISIWDADTTQGVEEAIGTMKTAATSFLRARDAGVRGTKNLFAVGQDLDLTTVKSALVPLDGTKYKLLDVKQEDHDKEIRPFVESKFVGTRGFRYRPGMAYYQLGSRVTVQASKDVAVLDTETGLVYGGTDALRLVFGEENVGANGRLIGNLSVKAGHNAKLKVFVESKSVNRKLKKLPGDDTKLLVMI